MFINFLTLPIIIAAGVMAIGAWFLFRDFGKAQPDAWVRGFAWAFFAAGAMLTAIGFHISFSWPIPGGYNIVFGEPLAYFGPLLMAGALALWFRHSLAPLLVLGAFGGAINIILGAAILEFRMTRVPALGAALYFSSGLAFLLLPAALRVSAVKKIAAALLGVSAILFAIIGYGAYAEHPGPNAFGKWAPMSMRPAQPAR